MEINTHNAEILGEVAISAHPQDDIPKLLLLGVLNVGKSSFINTMLNQKFSVHLGNLGNQLLNFFNIDDKLRFVDVPGYGYAKSFED